MRSVAKRATAPRGKAFAVFRLSHVAGADVRTIRVPGEWSDRDAAEKTAASIDWRLNPTIDVVARSLEAA